MNDLLTTGGAGGFGAILGAFMTFFGIKGKIKDVDKRIDRLTDVVAFSSTCTAVQKSIDERFKSLHETQTEMRDDIKDILKAIK